MRWAIPAIQVIPTSGMVGRILDETEAGHASAPVYLDDMDRPDGWNDPT